MKEKVVGGEREDGCMVSCEREQKGRRLRREEKGEMVRGEREEKGKR